MLCLSWGQCCWNSPRQTVWTFAFHSGQGLQNSSLRSHHGPSKFPQKGGAAQASAEILSPFSCRSTTFLEPGDFYDPRESLEWPVTMGRGRTIYCSLSWDLQDRHIFDGVEDNVLCLSKFKWLSAWSWSCYIHISTSPYTCGPALDWPLLGTL